MNQLPQVLGCGYQKMTDTLLAWALHTLQVLHVSQKTKSHSNANYQNCY